MQGHDWYHCIAFFVYLVRARRSACVAGVAGVAGVADCASCRSTADTKFDPPRAALTASTWVNVMGSRRLVELVCTRSFMEWAFAVAYFLMEIDADEGEWAALWSFVAWRRPDDAHKLPILEWLFGRCVEYGMCPLLLESTRPGLAPSEYPLVHGLLARNIQDPAPGPASDPVFGEFLVWLLGLWPGLASTFNRENLTPYVKAAQDGDLDALRLLERVVAGPSPAPGVELGGEGVELGGEGVELGGEGVELAVGRLMNPTENESDYQGFQEPCDMGPNDEGVWTEKKTASTPSRRS